MFIPVPYESHRSDDDCAAVSWRRGRKRLTLMLTCYGSPPIVRGGLAEPPGGVYHFSSFEEGWKWWCNDEVSLPVSPVVDEKPFAFNLDPGWPHSDK